MIPRVFVSSTYYDLKHVRERLEKFIENYGFEPVLFESDKVTYQHGKEIDQSAYFEVGLCHLMVLIVGGRYGSPSSQEKIAEERKKYDEDYISITRKEFETAAVKNIPILIFIDKNVYAEYQTYKENQDIFNSEKEDSYNEQFLNFKFAHVDHINVFKFIDIIKSKPIKTFEKVDEIESYIKSQLSGMFYLYLENLKKKSDDNKILDSVTELNNIAKRMNEMLTSVGKEILSKDAGEYKKVIDNQLNILIDFFIEQFNNSIEFENLFTPEEIATINTRRIAKIIYEDTIKIKLPETDKKFKTWKERENFLIESRQEILFKLQEKLSKINSAFVIKHYNFRKINKVLHNKVLPFITKPETEEKIINEIEKAIIDTTSLPF